MFDLRKKNLVFRAIRLEEIFPIPVLRAMNVFWGLAAVISAFSLLKPGILGLSSQQVFGIAIISTCFLVIGSVYMAFLGALREDFLVKKSLVDRIALRSVKEINLAHYLDFRVARATKRALVFCQKKGVPLNIFAIIFCLWKDRRGELIFEKLGLNRNLFKEKLDAEIKKIKEDKSTETESVLAVFEEAAYFAINGFHRDIEIRDFLVAASELNSRFKEMLSVNEMEFKDVDHVTAWEDFTENEIKIRKQFWRLENLMKQRGVGKQWAAGYTVNVDKYSTEITEVIRRRNLSIHLIGHDKEIYAIERILSRSGENNVLLVGQPGSGRSTIAYAFAKKVVEGRSFANLNDKRILELDMQAVFSGLDTPGDILERLKIIFSEAVNSGNVILVIDEIHNYLGSEKGPAAINITPIILPYLSSSNFQVIGITNYEAYYKYIETNSSVKSLFVKVEVNEPTVQQTIFILEDMLPGLERRYDVSVSYRILRDIVKLTERYIQNAPFPGKAIDILTEVLSYTSSRGEKIVLPEYVNRIVSERVEVPVGAIQEEERKKLLALEERIHQRVINQEEAVKLISEAMRRARAGIKGGKRPIGSFLFLGPTGVGKTETSKALAAAYFGSEERMIRFDMTEYQDASSVNRMIGFAEKGEPGLFTKAIIENPFSLVLLDEIEKTHSNILNLFLQVFDEGWLTDAFGKKVSFTNAIIIGTSNAGGELIRQKVKAGKSLDSFKEELIDYLLKQGIFKPEFLNRFDAVVVFKPLTHEHLVKIAILMINDLSKRLLEGAGIRLVVNPNLVDKIVELGYQPEFGARPMRRVIQDEIESRVAKKILQENLKRGDFIEIKAEEIED
ncbi:MAG: ATP-dependent Clp protease ATP-binding subunit [bacterium]|nr:ATP-dependent Clp protease ATP-binding subunit [bacterium]